jgi:hypothetical protein
VCHKALQVIQAAERLAVRQQSLLDRQRGRLQGRPSHVRTFSEKLAGQNGIKAPENACEENRLRHRKYWQSAFILHCL